MHVVWRVDDALNMSPHKNSAAVIMFAVALAAAMMISTATVVGAFQNLANDVKHAPQQASPQLPQPAPLPQVSAGLDWRSVEALAARLSQWLLCKRLNSVVKSDFLVETYSTQGYCQANFDGRLCWPTTAVGKEALAACPTRLRLPKNGDVTTGGIVGKRQKQIDSDHSATDGHTKAKEDPSIEAHGDKTSDVNGFHQNNSNQSESSAISRRACVAKTTSSPSSQPQQEEANATHENYHNAMINNTSPLHHVEAFSDSLWLAADYAQCRPSSSSANERLAFDPNGDWTNKEEKRAFTRLVDELDRIEPTIDLYDDLDLLGHWAMCITQIASEPLSRQNIDQDNEFLNSTSVVSCPVIFDGWRCWPRTRAGQTAFASCPANQPGFSAEHKAHKICLQNGSWYRHPMTNKFWSNYTTCVDTVDLAFRTKILNLYVIGNLISLVALCASLIIFLSFKNLKCTRVTIHKNLFLSFITNNLMWIVWYTFVVSDASLLQANPIACQLLHILLHYFLVSNYFWMFCEGLYLHTLLVVAFVSEDKLLKWFYLLGWLSPLSFTVAYAYKRARDDYFTNFCWMEESPHNMILMAPIGVSLLLNLIFLINIVRVLVTKLRAENSPDTHQTRKAVRATLILIPLLGLHYILMPFRPDAKSDWEIIYETIAAICTSFQGLCVAMLFCFCNAEVIATIKKRLKVFIESNSMLQLRRK